MFEITSLNTGECLQVANNDLLIEMDWASAKNACAKLGDGWRLPTKFELEDIYNSLYLKGRGNFKSPATYWSSTEDNVYGGAFGFHFHLGYSFYGNKVTNCYVRAVRSL